MNNYGISVWGLGNHALRRVIPAILMINFFTLVGVCSRSIKKVESCSEDNACEGWTDPSKMLANKKIKILMIELMTVIKYENDNLFNVYANLLEQYGFVMIDLHQGYRNNAGIMTEFDAVFMEKNMLKDFLKS